MGTASSAAASRERSTDEPVPVPPPVPPPQPVPPPPVPPPPVPPPQPASRGGVNAAVTAAAPPSVSLTTLFATSLANAGTTLARAVVQTPALALWQLLRATTTHVAHQVAHAGHLVVSGGGGNIADKVRIIDETLGGLRRSIEILDAKLERMAADMRAHEARAAACHREGRRASALRQMRLRRMYQAEIAKLEGLKFNLETNVLQMESVEVVLQTVSTINDTTRMLQLVHRHVDLDHLEDTIDTLFDQGERTADLTNVLTTSMAGGADDELTEDELLAELDELMTAEAPPRVADASGESGPPQDHGGGSAPASPPQHVSFPTVPTHEPAHNMQTQESSLVASDYPGDKRVAVRA